MKFFENIFSVKNVDFYKVIKIFGIKISFKNQKKIKLIMSDYMKIQDDYDLSKLENAKKIIVFLTPNRDKMSGGVMSIYSLCEATRKICPDAFCFVSTHAGNMTYPSNEKFANNEKIYRWKQLVEHAKNVQKLIIHIPEYYSEFFFSDLDNKDKEFLKNIEDLQLNILNQNIEYMPKFKKIKSLFKLTQNITQTMAHDRYANQDVCNKWQIPTHLFSVNIDISKYKTYPFEEKKKIIVISHDFQSEKEQILKTLAQEMSDFEIITVKDMTFSQYMDLIAKAYFTISFGEGFDGYFSQPAYVNSLGFAVYNDDFFPDDSWKELNNVYSSYAEMNKKIVSDMRNFLLNQDFYYETIDIYRKKCDKLYYIDKFEGNLRRFYEKNYDFYPKK